MGASTSIIPNEIAPPQSSARARAQFRGDKQLELPSGKRRFSKDSELPISADTPSTAMNPLQKKKDRVARQTSRSFSTPTRADSFTDHQTKVHRRGERKSSLGKVGPFPSMSQLTLSLLQSLNSSSDVRKARFPPEVATSKYPHTVHKETLASSELRAAESVTEYDGSSVDLTLTSGGGSLSEVASLQSSVRSTHGEPSESKTSSASRSREAVVGRQRSVKESQRKRSSDAGKVRDGQSAVPSTKHRRSCSEHWWTRAVAALKRPATENPRDRHINKDCPLKPTAKVDPFNSSKQFKSCAESKSSRFISSKRCASNERPDDCSLCCVVSALSLPNPQTKTCIEADLPLSRIASAFSMPDPRTRKCSPQRVSWDLPRKYDSEPCNHSASLSHDVHPLIRALRSVHNLEHKPYTHNYHIGELSPSAKWAIYPLYQHEEPSVTDAPWKTTSGPAFSRGEIQRDVSTEITAAQSIHPDVSKNASAMPRSYHQGSCRLGSSPSSIESGSFLGGQGETSISSCNLNSSTRVGSLNIKNMLKWNGRSSVHESQLQCGSTLCHASAEGAGYEIPESSSLLALIDS